MKVTVVPSQVTTIEDKIIGNLGVNQFLILIGGLLCGSLLYILLPPSFHISIYKIVVILALLVFVGILAVRIKGTIILIWLLTLLDYHLRPRFYVFDKSTTYCRDLYLPEHALDEVNEEKLIKNSKKVKTLTTAELVKVDEILADPDLEVMFKVKAGGRLYVSATQIKDRC